MKKQSESIGKFSFKKIAFCEEIGDQLLVTFDDNDVLYLSPYNYSRYYLYPDKIITYEMYIDLLDYESLRPYVNYVINLIKKKSYSQKQLKLKLINVKHLDEEKAKLVLKIVSSSTNIDFNRQKCESLLFKVQFKGYSFKRALNEFYKNNIYRDLALEYLNDYVPDETIIFKYIDDFYKRDKNSFKKKSTNKLVSLGFDRKEINYYLGRYIEDNDIASEDKTKQKIENKLNESKDNLNILMDNFYRFKCFCNLEKFTKNAVIQYFKRKGFSYNDICNEYDNFMDNLREGEYD